MNHSFFQSSDLSFDTQGRGVSLSVSYVLVGVRLELGALSWLWRASWESLSFSLRCAEDGCAYLAALEACSRRREDLSLGGIFSSRRNLPELLLGLWTGVSNEVVPFGGRSLEDISSEFGGVAGRSDKMEGSDRDHLYF